MRRQTQTSGINPAGSSRVLRLDPLSLPLRFDARDVRADGGVRQVEIHRERVVLRRAVLGMRMAVNVRVSDFIGIGLRGIGDDAQMLALVHRDPSLTVPLCISADREGLERCVGDVERNLRASAAAGGKAARTRRRAPPPQHAIARRRPACLLRRRAGVRPATHPSRRARDHRARLSSPSSRLEPTQTSRRSPASASKPANRISPASRSDLKSRRHSVGIADVEAPTCQARCAAKARRPNQDGHRRRRQARAAPIRTTASRIEQTRASALCFRRTAARWT